MSSFDLPPPVISKGKIMIPFSSVDIVGEQQQQNTRTTAAQKKRTTKRDEGGAAAAAAETSEKPKRQTRTLKVAETEEMQPQRLRREAIVFEEPAIREDLPPPLMFSDDVSAITSRTDVLLPLPLPKVDYNSVVVAQRLAKPKRGLIAVESEEPFVLKKTTREKSPVRSSDGKVLTFQEWVSSLPLPSPIAASDPIGHSAEWLTGFQRYIYTILSSVYTNDQVRMRAVDETHLRIWRRAFTDRSFASDHYETLETLGDKALNVSFSKYVYSKRPSVTPRELSNLLSHYMSNKFQPKLTEALKMEEWILFGKEVAKERFSATTKSIKEDIFESFSGALESVATSLHALYVQERNYEMAALHAPTGVDAVRRFVTVLFDFYGIEDKYTQNAAKTTIGEIGTIFALRHRNIYYPTFEKGLYAAVIPDELADALDKTEGVDAPIPRVLTRGHTTEEDAANSAREVLSAHGIDTDWITLRREEKNLDYIPPSVRDNLIAITKAKYPKLVFEIPISSKAPDGSFTMILTGVTINDVRSVLASGRGQNVVELKTRLATEVITKA